MTKMAAMLIYGKDLLKSSSPEQISPGALSLHKSSGTGDLPKLLKWWSYIDVWPFNGKVYTFIWEKCWEFVFWTSPVVSIIQLNGNFMMSIRVLMRHKIAEWADRKSKTATTAAILKINFRHLFSNLRSLWAETCFLATGWLLDRNKLKLCWSEIQDGLNGSAPLNRMAARAKK